MTGLMSSFQKRFVAKLSASHPQLAEWIFLKQIEIFIFLDVKSLALGHFKISVFFFFLLDL